MKKIISLAVILAAALTTGAQDLPVPSPASTLEQRVGLTDISIEYSRPGVKEREIFGELVPYGEMWRTGANKVPNIEFSTAVSFGGTMVKPGTYALLTIPGEDVWTIILNSNTEMWGTNSYNPDTDVARIEAEAVQNSFTETFTIDVNNIRTESADLVLLWAETSVSVPMEFEVIEQAIANIESALAEATDEGRWKISRNAANFYYNNDLDLDQALEYMNQSLGENKKSWYSHWLKAEILAEKGNHKEAIQSAQKSIKAGNAEAADSGNEFTYTGMIEESIKEWKMALKKS